jgi:hypothetical protein
MKFQYKAAVLIAGVAIGVTPALATAHGQAPSTASSKAKQYGKLCQGESKQHAKGTKGTPFSLCVTAAAKAHNGSTKSPGQLCKAEKKMAHHMKGQTKGTPFSDCVTAAAKAHRSGTTTTTTGTTTTTTTTTTGTTTTGTTTT